MAAHSISLDYLQLQPNLAYNEVNAVLVVTLLIVPLQGCKRKLAFLPNGHKRE